MPVRVITDARDLAELAPSWDRLAGDASFRRFGWCDAWWQAYGDERELATLVARNATDDTTAILPMAMAKSLAYGRRLELLGGGEACGDDLSVLVDPSQRAGAIGELAEWLTTGPGRRTWDTIGLDGVTTGDAGIDALVAELAARGVVATPEADVSRWAVGLPADWEAFVASLGKRTRRLVRQVVGRGESTPGVECRWIAAGEALAPWFDSLVELHKRRWEEGACRGAFQSPRFERFLRLAAASWHAEGSLELALLSVEGRAAAAAIGVRSGDRIDLFLLGRDPEFDRLQVGWMLNLEVVRNAIERGLKRIDFLRGDEPYKEHLGCSPIPQQRVVLTAPGAVNRVRRGARELRAVAAQVKRRVAGRE
ncbi:MAG: GNAT family N-acetyltransferase [Lacipirellulaceae bacterium]